MLPLPQSAARTGHFHSVNAAYVCCVPGPVLGAEDVVVSTAARSLHLGIPNLYCGTVLCKHILHKKERILVFTMQVLEEILLLVSLLFLIEYPVSEKHFGNNILLCDLSQAVYCI